MDCLEAFRLLVALVAADRCCELAPGISLAFAARSLLRMVRVPPRALGFGLAVRRLAGVLRLEELPPPEDENRPEASLV